MPNITIKLQLSKASFNNANYSIKYLTKFLKYFPNVQHHTNRAIIFKSLFEISFWATTSFLKFLLNKFIFLIVWVRIFQCSITIFCENLSLKMYLRFLSKEMKGQCKRVFVDFTISLTPKVLLLNKKYIYKLNYKSDLCHFFPKRNHFMSRYNDDKHIFVKRSLQIF